MIRPRRISRQHNKFASLFLQASIPAQTLLWRDSALVHERSQAEEGSPVCEVLDRAPTRRASPNIATIVNPAHVHTLCIA
jgi:hypothetical protein